MPHNLNHTKERCLYCSARLELSKWRSEFHHGHHYKINECNCGKKNTIKVEFIGSGHDDWSRLEKEVKRHRSKK